MVFEEGLVPNPECQSCNGLGEVWKYYKVEAEKVIHQPYAYCPACFPYRFVPMVPSEGEGWLEVDYVEANRLQIKEGYSWD